jgi:Uncharacterized protein conserved in bacteria
MLTILFLGDIVGEPGRSAVIARLPELKEKYGLDFIIVNGEKHSRRARHYRKNHDRSLTRGRFGHYHGRSYLGPEGDFRLHRHRATLAPPINYPKGAPGHGAIVLETAKGKVGVINVQCRTFMLPILENPFHAMEAAIAKMRTETSIIVVDVHGETTSEKIALARFLDGKVSAVLGTHTHVQTADEQIFPGGTAFLCDAGMCGPVNSIIGRAVEPIVQRFMSNLPAQFPVAAGEVRLHGALIEIERRPDAPFVSPGWMSQQRLLQEKRSPPRWWKTNTRMSKRTVDRLHALVAFVCPQLFLRRATCVT